jgi:Tfp pilus assembly protein FimT
MLRTPHGRQREPRNRRAVTLIEIVAAVVLAIVATAIVLPKLGHTRRASQVQSARTQVESYLSAARSVAIRTGVRAVLIRQGNTIRVMADSATGLVTVVRPIRIDSVLQVSLGATRDTIIYDSRGLATNLASSGERFYITSAVDPGVKDSICVTRLGLALDRKCGLVASAPEKLE